MLRSYKHWTLAGAILVSLILMAGCEPAPTSPQTPIPSPAPATSPATPDTTVTQAPTPTPESTPSLPTKPSPLPTPTSPTAISEEFEQTLKSHFGFMPAHWDFKGACEAGGAYDRPFFELFQWGMIEKEAGFFDFNETDRYVQQAQTHGLHILANLQPFAHWDQVKCHQDLPTAGKPGDPGFHPTKGKPCDMPGYKDFVIKLVERYDGDGIDDMPGLTVPIKHWEVLNEPEFQEEPLIFFQGSSADYFGILRTTHEAVKSADPDAYIVQGGMAGMMAVCTDFWQGVFDLGGADYFDIANMHSIGHGEHLNIPSFQQFLAENGIQDKPIWVTEVQFQQAHQTESYTNEEFAKILARSYIFALANGVDKLFYVNIKMPPFADEGIPFDERSALFKDNGEKSALFHAHSTVAEILGELSEGDQVEKIKERIGSWSIDEGQYRFDIKGRTVYALWGTGAPPSEIAGEVRVIEITGAERVTDSASLRLSDSPIFVIIE
jgi:hypothetical protein